MQVTLFFYSTCGLAEELEQEKKSSQPKSACGNVISNFCLYTVFAVYDLCVIFVFSSHCCLSWITASTHCLQFLQSFSLCPVPMCSVPCCLL